MREDGEGYFPADNNWVVKDRNNENGLDRWDDVECKYYEGGRSIWCADKGDMDDCGEYDNNMDAIMSWGDFDLSDALDAQLSYYYWLDAESCCDSLGCLVSIDGTTFYGNYIKGNSNGWQYATVDFSQIPHLGNVVGAAHVWIAFRFVSDNSIRREGAYLDNILLQKFVSDQCPSSASLSVFVDRIDRQSGEVVINGCETQPVVKPFLFSFGNGIEREGWFPQTINYQNTDQNYEVRVTSYYQNNQNGCSQTDVDFITQPSPCVSSATLSLNVQDLNPQSGTVVLNGCETRPVIKPFLFSFGNGIEREGWFPQTINYQNTDQNYVARVTAYYENGTGCAETEVVFSDGQSSCTTSPTLGLNIQDIDPQSGRVTINGGESRPVAKAFRFQFGDGTVREGWFPQTITYPVTNRNYTVKVTSFYTDNTCGYKEITVPFVAEPIEFFDDFTYEEHSEAENNGWYIRDYTGGPGITNAQWSKNNILFLSNADIVKMVAETDGSVNGTIQSELGTSERMFYEGTYAARIMFTDEPAFGPDIDIPVSAFFSINTPRYDNDPEYSECDFEYLCNGGWGETSDATLFITTWEKRSEIENTEDKLTDGHSTHLGNQWHIFSFRVMDGTVTYYLDDVEIPQAQPHGGIYYPESPMSILFNNWFFTIEMSNCDIRRYFYYIDWVYHVKDEVYDRTEIEQRVNYLKDNTISFRNTVSPH